MLGTLIRLALAAGTGAGIAGLQRGMLRIVWMLAAAVAVAILLAMAVGYFGFAVLTALTPDLGPAVAAAVVGLGLVVAAGILWLCCRLASRGRRRATPVAETAVPLGAVAGLEALSGLGNLVRRNSLPLLLTAFVAGMVMSRRR